MKTSVTKNKKVKPLEPNTKEIPVVRSDSYQGTSRDEFNDYDYQDSDSYEQPIRNSQKGYAPIDDEDTKQH